MMIKNEVRNLSFEAGRFGFDLNKRSRMLSLYFLKEKKSREMALVLLSFQWLKSTLT